MYDNKSLKNYVKKTVKNISGNKELMNELKKEAEKQDSGELEIVSVSELQENKLKRISVPLQEDIYYILSLYHFGEKLTSAEEDMIRNHSLKDRKEYLKKFKKYLPNVLDENIFGVVMWVMKKYLKFMAKLERTAMQVIFAERIIALSKIKKKGCSMPPHPSPDLMDFWKEYKKGKFTHSRAKSEVKECLNLLAEEAGMDFERERKDFYEAINKSFSEISDIEDNKNIEETLIKNIKKFISEKYKGMSSIPELPKDADISIQEREFPFMPKVLEIIIKSENLNNDFEVTPLIKKLEVAVFNLNLAVQMGVEDAMNSYKHNVLIYFYRKANERF